MFEELQAKLNEMADKRAAKEELKKQAELEVYDQMMGVY